METLDEMHPHRPTMPPPSIPYLIARERFALTDCALRFVRIRERAEETERMGGAVLMLTRCILITNEAASLTRWAQVDAQRALTSTWEEPMPDEQYVSVAEAAALLNVDTRTIYRRIQAGTLPALGGGGGGGLGQRGKAVRIPRSAVVGEASGTGGTEPSGFTDALIRASAERIAAEIRDAYAGSESQAARDLVEDAARAAALKAFEIARSGGTSSATGGKTE